MITKTKAHPRAALIGNPSDGYFGKTIALTFSDFQTDVTLYPSDEIEILPAKRDRTTFNSIQEFSRDVARYGYYGGIRIVKAAIAKFLEYCGTSGVPLNNENFTIRCHTSIPTHLGLAGSSSIITASFRSLMKFYKVSIPKPILANLILRTETEELGISAGLQDRVAQVYEGITYMDFDERTMKKQGYGDYLPIVPKALPNLYLAYNVSNAEESAVVHDNLRYRFEEGDSDVIRAMAAFADLTDQVRDMLNSGEFADLPAVMNTNFDLRASICAISKRNEELVRTARESGASAKFTGSGGAIIGTYKDENALRDLKSAMQLIRAEVLVPTIAWPNEDKNND